MLSLVTKRELSDGVGGGERASSHPVIVGPLGLWPFPLLNVLLQVVLILRGAYVSAPLRRRRMVTYEVVRDERGRIVEIVEHMVESSE